MSLPLRFKAKILYAFLCYENNLGMNDFSILVSNYHQKSTGSYTWAVVGRVRRNTNSLK